MSPQLSLPGSAATFVFIHNLCLILVSSRQCCLEDVVRRVCLQDFREKSVGRQRRQKITSLSALMAPFLLLLILLSEASSDLIEITVHPGDDVILSCQAAGSSIRVVEWTRPDLKPPGYVLFYIGGDLQTDYQHPSFKDRVELVDRDLKDGDVSLILKNVSSIDNGTYECRVESDDSRRRKRAIINSEPIRIIRLQVPDPAGSNSRHPKDENSIIDVPEDGPSSPGGLIVGLVAGVLLLVAAAVGGVLMYKRRKNKASVVL